MAGADGAIVTVVAFLVAQAVNEKADLADAADGEPDGRDDRGDQGNGKAEDEPVVHPRAGRPGSDEVPDEADHADGEKAPDPAEDPERDHPVPEGVFLVDADDPGWMEALPE